MIQFEKYYLFPAQEVESISIGENSGLNTYPFQLTVYLRSGRSLGVSYKTKEARDKAKASLEARIDNELNGTDRIMDIQLRAHAIEEILRGVEKRQLKIARMVKKLLPLTDDETKEDVK